MAGKWVDEGENRVADILFDDQAVDAFLYLGLYTDIAEPAETDALADLTEESGSGYARIRLDRGTWTIAADAASYAQQTFTAIAAWGLVYGYFISTGPAASVLLCVETFSDGPYNVGLGDSIKVTPKITVA